MVTTSLARERLVVKQMGCGDKDHRKQIGAVISRALVRQS
jgi:hypothetical protein